MSNLAERMREAADTLEEWSARQGYGHPAEIEWSAGQLRTEAGHLEAELTAIEQMTRDLWTAAESDSWDFATEALRDIFRARAARLIEMGYIKV